MPEVRLTRTAKRDIVAIMRWSLREFSADAAYRYDALLTQALFDVGEYPSRPGSQQRPELARGVIVYHLRFSRDRARSALGIVREPRHFLAYRKRDDGVEVLRVLHDARDLGRHLPTAAV